MKSFESVIKFILSVLVVMLIVVQYLHSSNMLSFITSDIIKMEGIPANEDGIAAKRGVLCLVVTGNTSDSGNIIVYLNGEPARTFENNKAELDVKNHDVIEIFASGQPYNLTLKVEDEKGGIRIPAVGKSFKLKKGLTYICRINME